MSLGFALYDWRVGPTTDENRVLKNIDDLAMYLRLTMLRCTDIRRTLKIGPDNMNPEQEKVAAGMMEVHVARPAAEAASGVSRQRTMATSSGPNAVPPRYCYVKLVAPDKTVNEKYHTYFWTRDGQRIPFETVMVPDADLQPRQVGV
jgi:hypothetical protein